ncbi:DUF7344 domain-containing protein [Natronorubrum halophilum]|uniref:DUF7344 domain-containing protein n=1 Tax=Natronorubrum halophilum TaxID=1702106 RepID=UPI000EF6E806|nr:hypothetical protein [Natronorubrum halophilum]
MPPDRSSSNGPTTNPETIDTAFLALRQQNCRFVCYFLLEHETASLSEVADVVTGWIHAANGGIAEPQRRNQCYLRLLHSHVPNLVDVGVVSYDERSDILSLSPCPDPIREFATRACAVETGS